MKRDYQRFLHERNRGKKDVTAGPIESRRDCSLGSGAPATLRGRRARALPGRPHPAEDRDGHSRFDDLEIVTPHYRGAHAGAAAKSGFTCYLSFGSSVGGRGGGSG